MENAPAANVRIVALGGFLGYVDGLEIGPPEDERVKRPLGGVAGAQAWLNEPEHFRRGSDLLLVTGNNVPLDVSTARVFAWAGSQPDDAAADYWRRLIAMRPDAIAFSIDDFLRTLKDGKAGGQLFAQLTGYNAPPFVVSNAAVRRHKKRLNTIDQAGLALEIPRDETIGWIDKLRLGCRPCAITSATVAETPARAGAQAITVDKIQIDDDTRHVTLTLSAPLRPGRTYALAVVVKAGAAPLTFQLSTHDAMTKLPRAAVAGTTGDLEGLPIRYVRRRVTLAQRGVSLDVGNVIVSMVNPDTKAELGADRWKWTPKDGPCDGDTCEIDFLPASDAFAALTSWTRPAPGTPDHVFVLMSGLSDQQTSSLVTAAPGLRFVVLDPDSSALAQDRGRDAAVNRADSRTTAVWSRPEWIGSSAATMEAHLEWDGTRWLLDQPSTSIAFIPGEKLRPVVNASNATVEYFLGPSSVKLAGPLPTYPSDPLWQDSSEMAAFLLDIMRRSAHADIALLPERFIDQQTITWLDNEFKAAGGTLPWLSRFLLGRVFFRTEPIVTANVEGAKLLDALDAIVKSATAGNVTLFAAGLGAGALTKIDKDHTRVNRREIVPGDIYKLALPLSIAEGQKLDTTRRPITPLLDGFDTRMRSVSVESARGTQKLTPFLEHRYAGRPRVYFSATPVKFDVRDATVRESEKGAFGNIPLAGRSVKEERQWSASAQADLGVDLRYVAFRLTNDSKFAKKTIAGTISYPTDEWTLGPRFDVKIERGPFHRVFVGRFRQSWFRDHVEDPITPTRKIETLDSITGNRVEASVSGPSVSPTTLRPIYDFTRAGLDFEPHKLSAWLTVDSGVLAFDFGRIRQDRESVNVAGSPIGLDRLFHDGMTKLVNDAFQNTPAAFAANPTVTFNYSSHDQKRFQLDGASTIAPPAKQLHGMKYTVTAQFRGYLEKAGGKRPDFSPTTSLDLQQKLQWTIINRFAVGPFINYYRVTAKGATGPFVYRDYGISVQLPLFLQFNPGRVFQ